MMRGDIHAAIEIKAMGRESLDPRIEREVLATILFCVFNEPIEERGAVPHGAIRIVRNQIVDVEGLARKEHFEDPEAGHRSHDPVELEISDLISLFLLLEDAGREINGRNVRA